MSTLELVVRRSVEIADGIREIAFADPAGRSLPDHPAGSHLIVGRNAYSLTNSGMRPAEYKIAVLNKGHGSARMHAYRAGDRVTSTWPRSTFAPVSTARRHLLVAGGIGITPLLAHVRDALRWGRDVRLHYVHRPGRGAYADELAELLGDRLVRTTDAGDFRASLALDDQPLGTHLYVCGPAALTDDVLDAARDAGWPAGRVHTERFVPVEVPPGRRFVARLARRGLDVSVPAGTSLLEALHAEGVAVPNMCRQGVCGECEVPVLAGRPEHRGDFRPAGGVLCCVSRSESDILVLDV
jgi:ferredoxin-NADP reductase